MITDQDLRNAWDRMSRTSDGELVYLYLQKQLCGILETHDSGALQRNEGRRSLARDLMAMMAGGIEGSVGQRANPADKPVVFAVRQPVETRASRGTRRRVTEDSKVPGWDTEDSPGGVSSKN